MNRLRAIAIAVDDTAPHVRLDARSVLASPEPDDNPRLRAAVTRLVARLELVDESRIELAESLGLTDETWETATTASLPGDPF